MNKIAIVGHPSTDYRAIEAMLQRSGMSSPAPSRKHGLTVEELHKSLRAEAPAAQKNSSKAHGYSQIQPAPAWNPLLLDLLLGNQTNTPWAWADPNALPLLHYWHEQDSNTFFILLYETPQKALQQTPAPTDEASLQARLDEWGEYHDAVIDFYQTHPRRSLLVHTQALLSQPSYLSDTLPIKLATPGSAVQSEQPHNAAIAMGGADDLIKQQIEAQLVAAHPAGELYDQLQKLASLPLPGEHHKTQLAASAWLRHTTEQATLAQAQRDAQRLSHEVETLQNQLHQKDIQNAESQEKLASLNELKEENELLLDQLHTVQATLEAQYRAKQVKQQAEKTRPYGAAERIKSQLSYRLGAELVQSKTATAIIKLPITLRRTYKDYKSERKAMANTKLPPISSYADAHDAERVKQHLSYRLGTILVQKGRSPLGWLAMPFAMLREARAYRAERIN